MVDFWQQQKLLSLLLRVMGLENHCGIPHPDCSRSTRQLTESVTGVAAAHSLSITHLSWHWP